MEKKHYFYTRWLAKIVSGPNTVSGPTTLLAHFLPFYLAKNIFPIIQLDKQTDQTKKNHNTLQKVLDIVSPPCYNRIINANDQQKNGENENDHYHHPYQSSEHRSHHH